MKLSDIWDKLLKNTTVKVALIATTVGIFIVGPSYTYLSIRIQELRDLYEMTKELGPVYQNMEVLKANQKEIQRQLAELQLSQQEQDKKISEIQGGIRILVDAL